MTQANDQDRLVHIFLLEAVGGETPPDLTQQILNRTTELAKPRARWRVPALAAAAAVIVATCLWATVAMLSYPAPSAEGSYRVVEGGSLQRGAVVQTDGPTTLRLGGYCRLEVEPGSQLKLQGQKKAEGIYLDKGSATCEVDRKIGTFAVQTEIGTVSVTGTKFTVRVAPGEGEDPMLSKRMMVQVLVGTVVLSGAWGEATLQAGQTKTMSGSTSNPPRVFGTITKLGDGTMTLQKGNTSETVDVTFNGSTEILISGKPGAAADLKVGMHAGAWGDEGKPATKIYAYMPKPPTTTTPPANTEPKPDVYGTISKLGDGSFTIDRPENKGSVEVAYNDATVFNIGGQKTGKASDLKVGMRSYVWVKEGKPATKVGAYMPKPPSTGGGGTAGGSGTTGGTNTEPKPDTFGTISKLGDGSMTLQKPNSTETAVVKYNDSTVILISGKEAKSSDLKVGMHAAAWTKGGLATKIYAYMPKHK